MQEIVLTGQLPIGGDPNDLPHHVRQRILRALLEDVPQPPANYGSKAIPADFATHDKVRELFEQDPVFRQHFLVGEEALLGDWEHALAAPVGAVIFALDAIDGSGPFDDLTYGYGTTLVALRRTAAGYVLLGTAICNSSGFLALAAREVDEWLVKVGHIGDGEHGVPLPLLPEDLGGYNRSIAVVGAKWEDRRDAAWLLEADAVERSVVYNLGGSPASLGLMRGKVGALIAMREQSTWDAAFLPMLSVLGVPLLNFETGASITWEDVVGWFSQLHHPDERVKPVPGFVAARTQQYAEQVLRACRDVREAGGQE